MRERGRTTEHPLLAAYHHCSQLPWTKGPGKGCGGGAGCQGTVMNEKDTGLGICSFRSNQIKFAQIAHSLFFNEICERITQVAHQKWANEQIARFFERISHSLFFSQKNERFAQKTDERIPSPEKTWRMPGCAVQMTLCHYSVTEFAICMHVVDCWSGFFKFTLKL